jgi:aquaporin Z
MLNALRHHWPEYLIEAAGLGLFMISVGLFATLLEYPHSPVHQVLLNPLLRRFLMGIAMGLTAMSIIYSPWGKQSGAHLNPSVTLTFFRLGKVESWDAFFYICAQFLGGIAGVLLITIILGQAFTEPPIHYVATKPGPYGAKMAFLVELAISFGLMSVVLIVSNTQHLARFTGVFAGTLVAIYITVAAPWSGMSMNPARTFASAFPAGLWTTLWIYFTAPPLGMLLASELYRRRKGAQGVICAKLHHHNEKRCIFRCGYRAMQQAPGRSVQTTS